MLPINRKIAQVLKEKDVDILIDLICQKDKSHVYDKVRIKDDFKKGYFDSFLVLESAKIDESDFSIEAVIGYAVFYFSYSTWQDRVIYLSDLWMSSNLECQHQKETLNIIINKLKEICRENKANRINFNLSFIENNIQISEWLLDKDIGAVDLTKEEKWSIYEMSFEWMKKFMELNSKMKIDEAYSVVKLDKMCYTNANYSLNLIHCLAEFEKMRDQVEMTEEKLIRDHKYIERVAYDGSKSKSRFYEALIMTRDILDEETKQKRPTEVGCCIYYLSYCLRKGRGCYLEDLYVKEEYRRQGLGTYLWCKMIEDCLENHDARFMQWAVLQWNETAIKLYKKYSSVDLHEKENIHLLRITKHQIYANIG
jgi:ribosomal protein S18 acetylase RimI-like enzyme